MDDMSGWIDYRPQMRTYPARARLHLTATGRVRASSNIDYCQARCRRGAAQGGPQKPIVEENLGPQGDPTTAYPRDADSR